MENHTHAARIRALWDQELLEEDPRTPNQAWWLHDQGYSLPSPGIELTGPANFHFWKFRIESVLEPENLLALISPSIARPDPTYTNAHNDASAKRWKRTSKLVARWILGSISVEIFNKLRKKDESYVFADEAYALIERIIKEMKSASKRRIADPAVSEFSLAGDVESSCPPHTKITVTNSHGNTEDFFSYTVQDVKMKDAMFQVMLAISFWGPKVVSIFADSFSIQVRLAHHFEDKEEWFLVCRDMVTMHGFHDVMDEDEDAHGAQGAREEERIEDVKEVEKTEDMEDSL